MGSKNPLGIRLNNPGNIERNNIKWQGLADIQSHKRFCSFIEAVYGIRAMFKIFNTYNGRGHNTVRKIISAWAPGHENPLDNYIDFVCSEMFVQADEVLDTENPHDMIPLCEAIVRFENGQQPYDFEVYETAYYLANGKEKPCKTLSTSSSKMQTPSLGLSPVLSQPESHFWLRKPLPILTISWWTKLLKKLPRK